MSRKLAIVTGASHGIGAGLVAGYHRAGMPSWASRTLGNVHPLGYVGDVSDVVDGILYLERAAFVTGETLHIDGGQVAGH
jgi:NAD(P)-dependent dehydrogenase (short-subunit alcohol dehydrogenase family)